MRQDGKTRKGDLYFSFRSLWPGEKQAFQGKERLLGGFITSENRAVSQAYGPSMYDCGQGRAIPFSGNL